jgi:mRNA-decapping enzyme 1B
MDINTVVNDNDHNLKILQRVDPEVDEVLATAGHVCLYYMHVTSQQWTRKNVEGSLFLLKRKSQPRFQMMVLNKLATENYIETIHGSFDFEVNAPYLMYTHGNSEIHGIWFYDEDDLHRLSTLLNRVKAGLPKQDILPVAMQADVSSGQVPFKPEMAAQAPTATAAQQANLSSLLKNANKNPNASPAPAPPLPSAPDAAASSGGLLSPSFFGAGGGTPGPSGQAAATSQGGGDNALQKLFAKAAPSPMPRQQQQQPASAANPLQKLFSQQQQPQYQQQQPQYQQQQQGASSSSSKGPPPPPPSAQVPTTATRAKVRAAFSRLLSNDAFVDSMVAEFRAVGLLTE